VGCHVNRHMTEPNDRRSGSAGETKLARRNCALTRASSSGTPNGFTR
jgi:hypothetical protein